MRINGKHIAKELLVELKDRIEKEEKQPTLAIIQIGNIQESSLYIGEKKRAGKRIGVKVIHESFPEKTKEDEIIRNINKYNTDNTIHGIIVQLPLPPHFNTDNILSKISPAKDVDGLQKNSRFTPPVTCAVLKILQISLIGRARPIFLKKLRSKNIVVIGRGKTGGQPIMGTFNKLGVKYTLIHTQTRNPKQIMQNADILISCVGKPNVVTAEKIKEGAILISIGVHRGKDGKLHGDYDETQIQDKASFYTSTPGGTGPLTVAYLMQNIVDQC